jgi:polysaccharide pyruvyl transferase WcaK-like protein
MIRVCVVNCYNDDNRGSAALNLAAIKCVTDVFGAADITLVPLAGETLDGPAQAFRHTLSAMGKVSIAPAPVEFSQMRLPAVAALRVGAFGRRTGVAGEVIERLNASDLVVSRGGVILHARESGHRGTISLASRLSGVAVADRLGVPYAFLGAQVGPVHAWGSERLLSRTLEASSLAIVRDQESLATVRRISSNDKVTVAPDSVFALARPDQWSDDRAGVLGVAVSSHVSRDETTEVELIAQRVAMAVGALDPSAIQFFVHSTGARSDDSALTRKVADRVSRQFPSLLVQLDESADPSPVALMDSYAECAAVISSRLHAVVLALAAGSIGISIAGGVTFKEHALLSEVGLPDFAPRDQVEYEKLLGEIGRGWDGVRDRARNKTVAAHERLSSTVQMLASIAG